MLKWFRGLSETTQGIVVAVTLGLVVFALLTLIRQLA
jgi:hypothetical protein